MTAYFDQYGMLRVTATTEEEETQLYEFYVRLHKRGLSFIGSSQSPTRATIKLEAK